MKCQLCRIIAGRARAEVVREWRSVIAIVPLNPVAEGHVIVLPHIHVADFTTSPDVTGIVMRCVAELAVAPCTVITAAGTSSTPHFRVHIIPPVAGDGLVLPWTGQQIGNAT